MEQSSQRPGRPPVEWGRDFVVLGPPYQQFATTIAFAVVISSLNALTLSPALCATILKRSKEKLPTIFDGAMGPVIRTVSSIDGSIEMFRTDPGTWISITKSTTFKYNKRPYFWYLNGYVYCPNVDWDAIRMEAITMTNDFGVMSFSTYNSIVSPYQFRDHLITRPQHSESE